MLSRYLVDQYFERIYDSSWKSKININLYSQDPYRSVERNIEDIINGNTGVLGVQGVPGSGKTTFYAYILAKQLKDVICNSERRLRSLYVYIAPTNDLLIDFIEKFVGFTKGAYDIECSKDELAKRIRVYGSKIVAEDPRLLKKIDDDVVLVISTDWQRVSARLGSSAERVQYYFIDEASRMTFVRFLVPIADGIARREPQHNININGIIVIGDENQAVGLDEEERNILLLREIKRLKDSGAKSAYFESINTSWRIPRGTEEPIKEGFYGGNLRAMGNPVPIKIENEKEINNILNSDTCKKYSKVISEFLIAAQKYPHVHIELKEEFSIGKKYDPERAKLVWCIAKILSLVEPKRSISVVSPYTQFNFAIRVTGDIKRIKFGTVASYLGREDDIIITIFGKEFIYSARTFYLLDPYSFNVQLSRHKGVLYTIGYAEELKDSVEYYKKHRRNISKDLLEGYEKLFNSLDVLLSLHDRIIKDNRP